MKTRNDIFSLNSVFKLKQLHQHMTVLWFHPSWNLPPMQCMPHWFVALLYIDFIRPTAHHDLRSCDASSSGSKFLQQEWTSHLKWTVHESAPCEFRTTSKRKRKKKKNLFSHCSLYNKKGLSCRIKIPVLQLYLLRLQRPRDVHLPRIIYSSLNVHITAGGGAQTKIMCPRGGKKGLTFFFYSLTPLALQNNMSVAVSLN